MNSGTGHPAQSRLCDLDHWLYSGLEGWVVPQGDELRPARPQLAGGDLGT